MNNFNGKYNKEIKRYYDSSQLLYRLFCYNSKTLGMHHGFWNKKTKNRQEAMENENQAIIDLADIKSSDIVLDAGCGVGGTVIYIARKTGAKVFGITLSQNQVKLAKQYALKQMVKNLTSFQVQDYTKTDFPANFFDVVYGIESVCHASSKMAFLKEIFRILKPGGKLIIADGYCSRKPANKQEEKIIKDFTSAFALKELATYQHMSDALLKVGFTNMRCINKLDSVRPSVRYFFLLALFTQPIVKLLSFFPLPIFKALKQNYIALISEGKAVEIDLFEYFMHYVEKPFPTTSEILL